MTRQGSSAAAWVFAAAFMALAPIRSARAQCEPAGDLPGLNGSVHAMVNWDPDGAGPLPSLLAVGGRFTMAGNTPADNIATWNPLTGQWAALGSGMQGPIIPDVLAVAVAANGDLLAAGSFETAGGVSANRIARWNGSTWSALGSGMAAPINALVALPNGDVVAGGHFSNAGGVAANHVARWNGTTWSSMGAGLGAVGDLVHALAVMPNGDVVAGGLFDQPGGVDTDNLARWNGTSWSAFGTGVDGSVWALAVMPNGDLIASGLFYNAGGVAANRVALWNGTSWSAMGSGLSGIVLSLTAFSNGDVVAGGTFTVAGGEVNFDRIARWNGSSWSAMGSGVDGTPFAMTVLPSGSGSVSGNMIAGGLFTTAGGVSVDHIAAWNGTAWSTLHPSALIASDAAAGDEFGVSVAVSGNTAVVGARLDDNASGNDAGAAYVYVKSGPPGNEVWTEQAKLIGNEPIFGLETGNQSGISVDVSGDTAFVGSWLWPQGNATGLIYIFGRSGPPGGEVWTQQLALACPQFGSFQYFGYSLSLEGDTAVVGSLVATGLNVGGQVFFYARSGPPGGEVWNVQQKFPPDGVPGDQFGNSVAMSPAQDTAIVGAWNEDNAGGADAGSAYIFVRTGPLSNPNWLEQVKLTASDGAAGDLFGVKVALSGDTAVVGAHQDDHEGGINAGSAYVFTRSGTVWTQQARLTASDATAGDAFGVSLALSGNTLVIGAHGDDHAGASNPGSAYVFTRIGNVWTEQFKMTKSDPAAEDWFGVAVALSGNTCVIGARQDDHAGGINAGSVNIFDLDCGASVCCAGDFDASSSVTIADVPVFVTVLLSGGACPAAPACCPGDLNADSVMNGRDVRSFVAKLLAGGTCP